MAGYWPNSFFCLFMDRDEVEAQKLTKKERGQYPEVERRQYPEVDVAQTTSSGKSHDMRAVR